jgi:cytochrome c oxidase subunit II
MSRRWRHLRVLAVALLALSAAGLALADLALADFWSPESGPTQNAKDVDTLYKIVFFLGLGVIALVWGVLFYSLFRYRARRNAVPAQIRGNTPLELGWTAAAVGLVTVLAVVTLIFLDDIKNPVGSGPAALAGIRSQNATIDQPPPPGGKGIDIKVSGQQFLWRYQYPNGAVSFHDMIVPRDTTVSLQITVNDVAHSWWIPKLGPKFDALPDLPNETWFKATKTGTFRGQCAELCGDNHAYMTAKVIVVEPDAYKRWVDNQKKLIDQARTAAQKQRPQFSGDAAATSGSEKPATGNFGTEGSKEDTGGGGS